MKDKARWREQTRRLSKIDKCLFKKNWGLVNSATRCDIAKCRG